MNTYCQIEYISGDSDVGMLAASLPWSNVVIADLRSVPTVDTSDTSQNYLRNWTEILPIVHA
jgi:hypothetical protein